MAQLTTYPAPPGLSPNEAARLSTVYSVRVTQSGTTKESFVYEIQADSKKPFRHNACSFTTFAFDGRPVTVEVKRLSGGPIRAARVYPSSYGVAAKVTAADTVRFVLDKPGRKTALILDDDWKGHPLFVFGDAPEKSPPKTGQAGVVYFGPGIHRPGKIPVASGQTIYLAGGAYVIGWIDGANLKDVVIRGRGILSTELTDAERARQNREDRKNTIDIQGEATRNILVEGITIIQQQHFAVRIRGADNVIRNVKTVGAWHPTTDGFINGLRGLIEDCFIKPDDDAIKVYHSGMVVRRNVIWQMENGSVFQLTWNWRGEEKGVRVYDNDIIRTEYNGRPGAPYDRPNCALIGSVDSNGANMHGYVFENNRAENTQLRLLSLNLKKAGRIHDITIRGLTVENARDPILHFEGSGISDIHIEGLRVNGRRITKPGEITTRLLGGASRITFA